MAPEYPAGPVSWRTSIEARVIGGQTGTPPPTCGRHSRGNDRWGLRSSSKQPMIGTGSVIPRLEGSLRSPPRTTSLLPRGGRSRTRANALLRSASSFAHTDRGSDIDPWPPPDASDNASTADQRRTLVLIGQTCAPAVALAKPSSAASKATGNYLHSPGRRALAPTTNENSSLSHGGPIRALGASKPTAANRV